MNKIREYWKRRGLNQEKLARRLKIDRSSVAKWESGCNTSTLAHLLELAKFFRCSIDELIRVNEKKDNS